MPKMSQNQVKPRETERVTPYNITIIRRSLADWKNHADQYESAAISKYREVKAYISAHKKELAHEDAELIYELICKYQFYFLKFWFLYSFFPD